MKKAIICKMSKKFMDKFDHKHYPEILVKQDRPYSCICIDTDCGYKICVPFRSNISHNNAYHFHSERSLTNRSGLDYTKSLIINDLEYIETDSVTVDNDEYKEMIENIDVISRQVLKYIRTYISIVKEQKYDSYFKRNYQYSTLQYFNDLLGV